MLNREPMGMKPKSSASGQMPEARFSAQPRADGDEARSASPWPLAAPRVSVLNREPMGMKLDSPDVNGPTRRLFQCSTASRWG